MSDYVGVVTAIGQAKIAAAIGGAALNLTTIRVGDGNGAPIAPSTAMTDLVRRVGAAYAIVSSGRDPVNANHWRVTALIPIGDGPFDIREIGVFDVAGDMIAVARHVLVEKRTPAQGAAVELLTDIVFPVSETAQVAVQVQPAAAVSIFQMLRAGFTVVESATVTAPPGAPALGRTHVVPAEATGAWATFTGYLTQWNGIVWVAANVPEGFLVVAQDKALDHADRWLRRSAGGWVSAMASETAAGMSLRATLAEAASGADVNKYVTPAGAKRAALAKTIVRFTATGSFSWPVPANVYSIRTKQWAPGGGGGYNNNGGAPSGGGSGAYYEDVWDVVPGQIVTGSLGAPGVGGSASPAQQGQPGGSTTVTVGGVTATTTGGLGGLNGATAGGIANAPAGGTYSGTSRGFGINGAPGPIGTIVNGGAILGGQGAGAPLGGPAVSGGQGAPSQGAAPGGGGGGAGNPVYAGATGGRGEVTIEY